MKSPYVPLSEAARQSVRNERAGTVKKLSAEESARIRASLDRSSVYDQDRDKDWWQASGEVWARRDAELAELLAKEAADGEALEARTATGLHCCEVCGEELEDPWLCPVDGPQRDDRNWARTWR